jgi:hypothetical protein
VRDPTGRPWCAYRKNLSSPPKSDVSVLQVSFGALFADDRCANIFEALVGTLRAAKKRKVIHFEGEMLLQGVHDDVDVVLLD